MKMTTLVLAASLLLNLAFGLAAWRVPAATVPPGDTQSSTAIAPTIAVAAPNGGAPVPAGSRRPPLWAGLPTVPTADSIGPVMDRLRSAGCPPRDILAVVQSMLVEIARQKRAALGYATETLPYWRQFSRSNETGPNSELLAIQRENDRLYRTYLLTPELFAVDDDQVAFARLRFGVADIEKLRLLSLIEAEGNERALAIADGAPSRPGEYRYESDGNAQAENRRRVAAAAAAVLTPEEFVQYELRNGIVAEVLGRRIEGFRPTEEEYKALHAIEKAYPTLSFPGTQTPEQRKAAEAQQQAAIKAALTPERAAEYEVARKSGYDPVIRMLARMELPLVTVNDLNAVREQAATKLRAILGDPQLTSEQRAARREALANETEASLGATLGSQRALEAYKDLRGEWLRNLRNPPATVP